MLKNTVRVPLTMRKPGLLEHFLPGEHHQEELNPAEHPCATHHTRWPVWGRYRDVS